MMGHPGSVHDNRAWLNSRVYQFHENYFSRNEYLVGDSAFEVSNIMVAPYRRPRGGRLDRLKEKFNTVLSKARVRNEHCIGILKGRFQYFRSIRCKFRTDDDMCRMLQLFKCACILHNLLSEEVYLDRWLQPDPMYRNIQRRNGEVRRCLPASGDRRERVYTYMMEHINS
jgi:hypothetical protein